MTAHDTQSFFTPNEFSCFKTRINAKTYNLAHVLLNRNSSKHLFIPIRSLQYLAIIEQSTFWFVDSLAYATRGDEGGRLIRISWHPTVVANQRESLTQNMDCQIIYYGKDMKDVQSRLSSEFFMAMQQIDQHHRDHLSSDGNINILPLRPTPKHT
ncbi:MAG: hypothetical protein COB30_000560 [Ectothiorhodospiraceae bacterium]|nr:hypothetical protein [Ectothiorhodospiraceae bacterium]